MRLSARVSTSVSGKRKPAEIKKPGRLIRAVSTSPRGTVREAGAASSPTVAKANSFWRPDVLKPDDTQEVREIYLRCASLNFKGPPRQRFIPIISMGKMIVTNANRSGDTDAMLQ